VSRHRHPEGSKLPALERNILKYRAFEMMLTLFYAEDLKQYLVGTIKATDHWATTQRSGFRKVRRTTAPWSNASPRRATSPTTSGTKSSRSSIAETTSRMNSKK
jgi:hypothetical protein